jgi:hypothetical protein
VGVAAHPEWLEIRFASEGLELKEGARVYAEILAPRGKVEIGNHAELTGGIEAARLTVRRHGGLQLQARPVVNPPVDPALLPYAANFEVAQSYGVGSLAGQQGWEVTRGTAAIVAAVPAADGVWSVEIGAGAEVRGSSRPRRRSRKSSSPICMSSRWLAERRKRAAWFPLAG